MGTSYMTPLDLAREFIKKGRVDEDVCSLLATRSEIEDAAFGLHAQQAVEKYLKAVLAIAQERPQHTHDLSSLAGQCEEAGHALPSGLQGVFDLTPFAREVRYPYATSPPIDRIQVLDLVVGVRKWAEHVVS